MLAIQLKNYLEEVPDTANIFIFTTKGGCERQLLFGDLDKDHNGNIVIDGEYDPTVKTTTIENPK